MLKAVLIVDESGAKGYSSNQEDKPNELGVMAGYLVLEEDLEQARSIASKFFRSINVSDKLHLTDLTTEQQKEVRELIYQVFKFNHICWFYEAIYVQGFHESVHAEGRGGLNEKERLHSKLFFGVFTKAISRLRHERNKQLSIRVITDTIDERIIKEFKSEVKDYVNVITRNPIKRFSKIYNKENKDVETYEITSTTTFEDEEVFFDSIQYDIQCEDSPITFVADVLANSTLYYLREKVRENSDTKLNSKRAIENHPLSSQAYGTYDAEQEDIGSLSDLVYRREKT
jgi:hypothetical protein